MTDPHGILQPGEPAPDFTLAGTPDRQVRLSASCGGPTVLAFYPADWSPVCSDQMSLYQAALSEFTQLDAVLLGISVDSIWCHRAFAEARGIQFPLLADFEPKGAVAHRYGAYSLDGYAARALFVLDPAGAVAWSQLSPDGVNPGVDGILDALEGLRSRSGVPA